MKGRVPGSAAESVFVTQTRSAVAQSLPSLSTPHQRFRVSASNEGPLGARVVVAPLSDGSLTCGTAALWGAGLGALLPCDRCAVHTSCCVVFAVNCDKLNRLLALMTF